MQRRMLLTLPLVVFLYANPPLAALDTPRAQHAGQADAPLDSAALDVMRTHYRNHNVIAFFSSRAEREALVALARTSEAKRKGELPPRLKMIQDLMTKAFERSRIGDQAMWMRGAYPDHLLRFPESVEIRDGRQHGRKASLEAVYRSVDKMDGWHGTGLDEKLFRPVMVDSLLPQFFRALADKPKQMPASWERKITDSWVREDSGWFLDRNAAAVRMDLSID